MNVLFVPQKLQSDGECGVTAAQQSLNPQVLSFMKGTANLVLGQHFHKVNDLATVEALAKEFDLYVPGMNDENPEVFESAAWLMPSISTCTAVLPLR